MGLSTATHCRPKKAKKALFVGDELAPNEYLLRHSRAKCGMTELERKPAMTDENPLGF